MVTPYEYGRAVEALRQVLSLFEDKTFVRNTGSDHRFERFAESAFKTTAVLGEAQKIVQEYDAERGVGAEVKP